MAVPMISISFASFCRQQKPYMSSFKRCAAVVVVLTLLTATSRTWGQCAPPAHSILSAAAPVPDARFGCAVSISGDTLVAGASQESFGGYTHAGAAYVFTRVAGQWNQQARLQSPAPASSDYFAETVAISGNTAVIGQPSHDRALVFVSSGASWSFQATLSSPSTSAEFADAVAISEDTVLIGAQRARINGIMPGAAYVFVRSGNVWNLQGTLVASDAAQGDYFGHSVALQGDTALVGAPWNDDAGLSSGSAYVFTRSGTSWAEQQKLTNPSNSPGVEFGKAVALAGDTAVIGQAFTPIVFTRANGTWTVDAGLPGGAYKVSIWANTVAEMGDAGNGRIFIFRRFNGAWVGHGSILISPAMSGPLALEGETVVCGRQYETVGGVPSAGAVHIFELACNVPGLPGDANCDGRRNDFDIDPFILAILDPPAYAAAYPNCPMRNTDMNADGVVNNFDIDAFVGCLVGPCP